MVQHKQFLRVRKALSDSATYRQAKIRAPSVANGQRNGAPVICKHSPKLFATSVSTKWLFRFTLGMLVSFALGQAILGQGDQPTTNQKSPSDLTPVLQDRKWGYADGTGRVVIKPQFSRAGPFSEGLALVWTGGVPLTDSVVTSFVKMGYINASGHWVVHSRFEYYFFDDFSEGVVPFRKQSSRWGYMDKRGKIVVSPRYDWAGNFSEGIAPVLLDGKCAHIDRTGRLLDQSQTILPRQRGNQDRHGTYLYKPRISLCP
jgi:hypothetical protein